MGHINKLAIVAYNGCLASELFGFRDMLMFADRIAEIKGAARISASVVTVTETPVLTSGGESIRGVSEDIRAFDRYVIPGFFVRRGSEIPKILVSCSEEIALLRQLAEQRKFIGSICVGAFLLGEAGLLDHRRGTTAWYFANELQRRYPLAYIDRHAILIDDGPITTAGAFSSAHDLALSIVERICGREVSRLTRNLALVEDGRTAQTPFIDEEFIRTRNGTFSRQVETWLQDNLVKPYSLERLSAALATSSRSLLRKYKAEKGQSPLKYLQAIRIERAKSLLEHSSHNIERIGEMVGYRDMSAFRSLFIRNTGEPPGAYRRRFRKRMLGS